MGYVYFQLNHSASLQTMVPAVMMGGGFGAAALPAGMAGMAGIYIIINSQTVPENRYIGISGNIATRFGPRMEVVTELGFPIATMANIHVVWGTVKVRNHALGAAPTTPTPVMFGGGGAPIAFPTWAAPGWTNAIPAGGGAAFNAVIDGNVVNLEKLLIRMVMMRLGAGGTVSNNMLMTPMNHPGGALPLVVKFHSAPFGNYNGYTAADTLAPGFVW